MVWWFCGGVDGVMVCVCLWQSDWFQKGKWIVAMICRCGKQCVLMQSDWLQKRKHVLMLSDWFQKGKWIVAIISECGKQCVFMAEWLVLERKACVYGKVTGVRKESMCLWQWLVSEMEADSCSDLQAQETVCFYGRVTGLRKESCVCSDWFQKGKLCLMQSDWF